MWRKSRSKRPRPTPATCRRRSDATRGSAPRPQGLSMRATRSPRVWPRWPPPRRTCHGEGMHTADQIPMRALKKLRGPKTRVFCDSPGNWPRWNAMSRPGPPRPGDTNLVRPHQDGEAGDRHRPRTAPRPSPDTGPSQGEYSEYHAVSAMAAGSGGLVPLEKSANRVPKPVARLIRRARDDEPSLEPGLALTPAGYGRVPKAEVNWARAWARSADERLLEPLTSSR